VLLFKRGVGHNPSQEALEAFANAVIYANRM